MEKARKVWKRFCLLAEAQRELDSLPTIGEATERNAFVVNVFRNDGIRRARALQLLKDLEKALQEEGISLAEFARIH